MYKNVLCVVHICTCLCMYTCVNVEAIKQPRESSFVSVHLGFWDRVTHWPGAHWVGGLASKSEKSSCVHIPRSGITITHHHTWVFFCLNGFLETNSGPFVCTPGILPTKLSPYHPANIFSIASGAFPTACYLRAVALPIEHHVSSQGCEVTKSNGLLIRTHIHLS